MLCCWCACLRYDATLIGVTHVQVYAVQQQLQAATAATARLESELKDYKARAQALLRAKDQEVAVAKQEAAQAVAGTAAGSVSLQELALLRSALDEAELKVESLTTELTAVRDKHKTQMQVSVVLHTVAKEPTCIYPLWWVVNTALHKSLCPP